jgi:hypothetical protein
VDDQINEGRNSVALRLAVLVTVYVVVAIGCSLLLSESMHRNGPNAVLGARYSMNLFLTPNVLTFLFTALWIKRSWVHLSWRHCAGSAIILAPVTIVLIFAVVFFFYLVFGEHIVSWTAILAVMLVPGILTAQLLRLAERTWSGPAT